MGSGFEDDPRGDRKCEIDSEGCIVHGNIIATEHIHHMGSGNWRDIPQFHYVERFTSRCHGSQMEFQCHVEGSCYLRCGSRHSLFIYFYRFPGDAWRLTLPVYGHQKQ